MDEALAWLRQGAADHAAAGRLDDSGGGFRCHAIAKWQQAVEKSMKSVVAALGDAGVLHSEIGYRHEVERFLKVLIRIPRADRHKDVARYLRALLDERTRGDIRALDRLVPRRPAPGQPPRLNTEYPFRNAAGDWSYPAAPGAFRADDVKRYRALSHRIVTAAHKISSALRRGPGLG